LQKSKAVIRLGTTISWAMADCWVSD